MTIIVDFARLTAAMTRISCHAPTKVYVARRTAEGKSKRGGLAQITRLPCSRWPG